mmetsp:Transcript_129787/g.361629  ORF Transcript_129787/g.361629 Transcript_129787/m.361629 type:complete len:355 (-) Transcript_129787:7-1071(-)
MVGSTRLQQSRSPLRPQVFNASAGNNHTQDADRERAVHSQAVPNLATEADKGSTLNWDDISVVVSSDEWVQTAASIFRDFGVVILKDLLPAHITDLTWTSLRELYEMWGAKYDPDKVGNRCPGRYDMGAAYNTQHLTHLPGYLEALEEFAQKGGLQLLEKLGGYKFVGGQGTLILANTDNWQPIHSDCYQPWHKDLEHEPEHAPCIDLMFTVHPLTSKNGAMRILPGQPSWDKIHKQHEHPPPKLDTESESSKLSQLYPLPSGCGILRDIRIWHGGVPNTSSVDRHIPVLQFYSHRALKLCPLDIGKGVDENDVRSKLSAQTQEIVASEIVRREGDAMPWLDAKQACWPGAFNY